MKFENRFLCFLLLFLVLEGALISCSEDENLPNAGKPMVRYIRVTDPVLSDSLLVKANQNKMVAIMGVNLGNAHEVWFNDRQAYIPPTHVSNTSIITRVPQELPVEVTNTLKIIFANGDSLLHPFTVTVSAPKLEYMLSEYVKTGDIAVIRGDYFYAPVAVTFAGGVEGEVVQVSQKEIQVKVPEGAQPGPVTVESNFGATESDFHFRDNRNIILSFDGPIGGLSDGLDLIKEVDPDIESIKGKFLRINQVIGGWQWTEVFEANANTEATMETANIPQAAIAKPAAYVLKFEINTLASLTGAQLKLYMGPNTDDRGEASYFWTPNLHTEGEWQTVSIPFSEFYNANLKFPYNPDGYGLFFYFHGPNEVDTNIAIDNLRVVPN